MSQMLTENAGSMTFESPAPNLAIRHFSDMCHFLPKGLCPLDFLLPCSSTAPVSQDSSAPASVEIQAWL